MNYTCFHPVVQTSIIHLANPQMSLAEIGEKFGISKQAVAKRLKRGTAFFSSYGTIPEFPEKAVLEKMKKENKKLQKLVNDLRLQIVIRCAAIFLLKAFKENVQKFFPRFTLKRLSGFQKKRLIDYWKKYESLGGIMKDYCQAIERSPSTLRQWLQDFERYGTAGLFDKSNRPHHFGNQIPLWLRNQLFILFIEFPKWTPFQYYKYITGHPAWHCRISVPTIKKLKAIHAEKSAEEKARLKKLWAFAPGTAIWTVDFICLFQNDRYKLQLLTVSDAASRFLFDTALFLDTSTDLVIDHLQDLFLKYGKPYLIKADNGPEFRINCREKLAEAAVHLMNSPVYYGQFNGAHERIHRTLRNYVEKFAHHCNLERLVVEIRLFRDEYNHDIPLEYLEMKTPAEIFYCGNFFPKNVEIVSPYIKDNECRMKFTNRYGKPARMAIPLEKQTLTHPSFPVISEKPPSNAFG
jgi:predicted DNA-binding protein YlxM (UPF0122 family)